jgi:hypothetical protein
MKITTSALAAHLFCTRAAVGDYLSHGVIERTPDGGFDLDDCRKRVLKHLRERSAGRTGDSGAHLSHERALLAKEQRETAALKNAISRGELVAVSSVGRILTAELLSFRESVLGLAGKESDALCTLFGGDAQMRGLIEEHLRDAVHEILETMSSAAEISLRADKEYQSWRGRR